MTSCGNDGRVEHIENSTDPLSLRHGGDKGSYAQYRPEGLAEDASWNALFGAMTPCVVDDSESLTLEEIRWDSPEGTEPEESRVVIRHFTRTPDDTGFEGLLGTIDDPVNYEIGGTMREGVDGFKVTARCDDVLTADERDELIISLQAGPQGAYIRDIEIDYRTGNGDEFTLQHTWEYALCGTKVAESFDCSPSK